MKTFMTCINRFGSWDDTAVHAQEMVSNIAGQLGFKHMGIFRYDASQESAESLSSRYDGIIAGVSWGDIVFFQYPTWNVPRFEEGLTKRIKSYGGRLIIVVHDMEPLMFESSRFMLKYMVGFFNSAEVLVVPSYSVIRFLLDNGVREDMKFVVQEIWDYTTDIRFPPQRPAAEKTIHFAGRPSKFLPPQWDFDVPLKVYTTEQYSGEHVQVMGWMERHVLLLELAKGGFGLVWTENEYTRQYMQYNCNFKLSAYLAAGIPVMVPRGISNQYLIERNHLGFAVDSLDEAVERVKNMSEAEYQDYAQHVKDFAPLLRSGYFTKKFLIEAVHTLLRTDMPELPIPGSN